jgi:CubicO group peptidase (beta-lactamase class C family)
VRDEAADRLLQRLLGGDFFFWSPGVQSDAFLSWDRIYATRDIPRGVARPWPRADRELDLTFTHRDVEYTVDDLIRWEFLSGLLVVHDGRIHLERYARGLEAHRHWQSSSMVKSLASILVGAAIQDGAIGSVDEHVVDHLPELRSTAYDGVTIRHLLQMSSGIGWVENTADHRSDIHQHYMRPIAAREAGHTLSYLATIARTEEPGTRFSYSSADSYLLGRVLARATGRSIAQYCGEKLWMPLGCERDGYLLLDADDGAEVMGSSAGATLRDYARWGELMLADGVIDGSRILPEGWVAESTAPTSPQFEPLFPGVSGYGYQWWTCDDGSFQARGACGQWLHVDPVNRTIVVLLGAIPRSWYLSPEEADLHRDSSHTGSMMRSDFIRAATRALSTPGQRGS